MTFCHNALGCSHIGAEIFSLETTVFDMMVHHQQADKIYGIYVQVVVKYMVFIVQVVRTLDCGSKDMSSSLIKHPKLLITFQ